MSRYKRTPGEQAEDRRIIANMYTSGSTQAEIKDWLNDPENRRYLFRDDFEEPFISTKMVSDDWLKTFKEWQKDRIDDVEGLKAIELAQIEIVEKEALDAWERSKSPSIIKTTRGKKIGGTDNTVDHEVREAGSNGDPRFLAEARMHREQRIKILGLYAPQKRELTGKDGGPLSVETNDLQGMTNEELEDRVNKLKKLQELEGEES